MKRDRFHSDLFLHLEDEFYNKSSCCLSDQLVSIGIQPKEAPQINRCFVLIALLHRRSRNGETQARFVAVLVSRRIDSV